MKSIIQINYSTINQYGEPQTFNLGYIGKIYYKNIEKARKNPASVLNGEWGKELEQLFKTVKMCDARIYRGYKSISKDMEMLNNEFGGMHYHFTECIAATL